MNTKKILMAGMVSLSMICSGGVLVGCSNTSKTTTTETTTKKAETKTIGEKTENSKSLKVINKTGKGITVFETKSSSDEAFSENLLTDGDVVKKNETRVLYYTTNENDTLSIKVGLKNSDSTFTFDKVDETEKIKNVEININDDEKLELTVNKKDDSKITITASADETKSEDEKENEEKVEETAKAEDAKSDSSESKSDKTASSSSSKSENKTSTTTNSNSSSSGNKTNSNSSNKNESTHTHDWIAQYKTVHHDAEYTTKYVIDTAAYDEQIPQREMKEYHIAYPSGTVIVGDPNEYLMNNNVGDVSWKSEWREVVVGYTTVHHDEVGHNEQVVVKEAYDEKVLTGYKCSKCGATK